MIISERTQSAISREFQSQEDRSAIPSSQKRSQQGMKAKGNCEVLYFTSKRNENFFSNDI